MQKLLIATTNPGKFREYKQLLSGLPFQTVSLQEIGMQDDIEETGKTYTDNAKLKAVTYAKKTQLPAISDDGGLEIDALDGVPGLHSRRWVGGKGEDKQIIEKMTQLTKELPENDRGATFRIVIAFALPNGKVWTSKGSVEGVIAKNPKFRLIHGYPYRSFFYLPKIKKYYQELELTQEESKEYNHRYKAFQKLKPIILKNIS